MGFVTSLFGGSENQLVTVVLSLAVVLVLIVLGLWALKMIFQATGNVSRGRNKRLSVVDSMAIDPKRQLVLLRRDNVEHLVLVGGSADLLVETDIAPPSISDASKRQRYQSAKAKSLKSSDAPPTTTDPRELRNRSLRDTRLLRVANRQEPDLNPQPFANEPRFDEANARDSAKSALKAERSAEIPSVSHYRDLDGDGSAQQHQTSGKKRKG